jgi:hypothetical protein
LLDCRFSILHVHRPKPLQLLLVNGAVSPSVSLDLFVDVRRKSSHISNDIVAMSGYLGLDKYANLLSGGKES